ncbi:MAG: prephenate dehydrogenase [Opitutales bacterium]
MFDICDSAEKRWRVFERLTILGAGLLGGSLLWAAREKGLCRVTAAWSRRAETREACARSAWCDEVYETPQAAVAEADAVVVCVPVERIAPLVREVAPALKPQALVMDVGSTKGKICASLPPVLNAEGAAFVGAHPMAGSEKTGIDHARADLFDDRNAFITPVETTSASMTARAQAFWSALGMRVHVTTPETHDAIVAHVSHLPHLVASALAQSLSESPPEWLAASGPGLRDTTRVAGGDPSLWLEIVRENRPAVRAALSTFTASWSALQAAVEAEDDPALEAILTGGQRCRSQLEKA